MSVKITYFVHGTTFDNENNISSGWSDIGLSPLGIKQSQDLRNKVADKHFDIIFTSDLKRAVDSANIIWGDSDIQIIKDSRLRECNYGDYNGQPSDIVEPMQEKSITTALPNGESYLDVEDRIKDFLNDLIENYDEKSIAIVAHKAPQLALNVLLKGITWSQAFQSDWRKVGFWQPGWEYVLDQKLS